MKFSPPPATMMPSPTLRDYPIVRVGMLRGSAPPPQVDTPVYDQMQVSSHDAKQ